MLSYRHVEDTSLNISGHRDYWFKKGYNFIFKTLIIYGFPHSSVGKVSAYNAGVKFISVQ